MNTNIFLILTAIGTYLLGWLTSYVQRGWQLLFLTVRIPKAKLAKIYYHLNLHKTYRFSFVESFPSSNLSALPEIENSFILCNRIPLWLDISEKYLTAGWNAKEEILAVTVLRMHKSKLFKMFADADKTNLAREYIQIFINQGSYFRELNRLNKNTYKSGLYLDDEIDTQIYTILDDFETNKRPKSSFLLYGPPGNGKTSIIKDIACRYDYNIYVPVIRPDMTNDAIINLFADIPREERAVIVLEDFDNIFNGRYCELRDPKFTFDVFLNILDGLYVNLDNKLVVITANNLHKIDKAIKNRPSRMDYILHIGNPDYNARLNILIRNGCSEEDAKVIAGITEDQSAAIVAEIGKRKPTGSNIEDDVKIIVDSFVEDPMPIPAFIDPIDNVAEGIIKSIQLHDVNIEVFSGV